MQGNIDSLVRLENATIAARQEGRLDVALSLAMMREALIRDRPFSIRQSYWPAERQALRP